MLISFYAPAAPLARASGRWCCATCWSGGSSPCPSLIGNIAEPLITLVAFGYGVGSLVGQVDGLPYIQYLASGSVAVSAAIAATFEALYSAYSRMEVQKTWDCILNAPIALDDIVLAEMLWAAFKAIFSCAAILVVIFAARHQPRADDAAGAAGARPGRASPSRRMALIFNALAKGYDFFTYYFTLVITPMTFLSGVYFPISQMPPWLQGGRRGAAAEGGGRSGSAARSGQHSRRSAPAAPDPARATHAAATIWRWCSPGAGSSASRPPRKPVRARRRPTRHEATNPPPWRPPPGPRLAASALRFFWSRSRCSR